MDIDLFGPVASVRALFGAAACSCAVVDEEGETLTFVAADGEGATEIVGVTMPVGRGLAGWAVMSGQPLAVRDVRTDSRFARDVAEATRYVPTAVLAAPIFTPDGEVLGVLEVLDPGVDEASDWTLAVLGTLASLMGGLVAADRAGTASPADVRLAQLGRRVLAEVETFTGRG